MPNGHAGLGVPKGTALTINDSSGGGELHATGGSGGAGIGGGEYGAGGTITGVTVTATGDTSKGASAIGAGDDSTDFGSLTNSGTLILPTGSLLDVPTGITVDNSGTIENHGVLQGGGAIDNSGAITGDGSIHATLHGGTLTVTTAPTPPAPPQNSCPILSSVADPGDSLTMFFCGSL